MVRATFRELLTEFMSKADRKGGQESAITNTKPDVDASSVRRKDFVSVDVDTGHEMLTITERLAYIKHSTTTPSTALSQMSSR